MLRAIKERYDKEGQPVYVAFIDFRKAFDRVRVPREKLFKKLEARGISGWFLDAVRAGYVEVPLCVKTPGGLTDLFFSGIGLTQGRPDSPDLYGFYTDDLVAAIKALGAGAGLPSLDCLTIDPLLHADGSREGFRLRRGAWARWFDSNLECLPRPGVSTSRAPSNAIILQV